MKNVMNSVSKSQFCSMCVVFVISLVFAQVVSAKEYLLSEVEAAAFSADASTLQTIYQQAEGRVKHVAGYRLVTLKLFAFQDTEGGKALLTEMVSELENSLEKNRKNGEGWAILASLRGLQIMTTPEYASVYGPKVGLEMALASDYGKKHPVVYLLQGISLYNTPEQYGGSKEKALDLLNLALELYSQAEAGEHWGLMDAYAWRGQAQLGLGKTDAARSDIEKALKLAPQSPWLQGLLASIN